MYISRNIRFLRKRAEMTQEALAKKIGKTSITISDYEKGKSTPPIDVALKLCEIFGVDLNGLVSRNLEREDFLSTNFPGNSVAELDLNKEYELLRQLSQLQGHRLTELEREIREHAPELAKRLGLEG